MQKNIVKPHQIVNPSLLNNPIAPKMIEVIVNDRLGKKERIKCWYFLYFINIVPRIEWEILRN